MAKSKKPSGWENELRRRKQQAAIAASNGEGDGSAEFAELGPPDLDDPATLLDWSRKYQATAAYLAATRTLTESLQKRLSLVDKFVANIGVTQNRSELEERLVTVETLISNVKPHGAVQVVEANGHARAATSSRGGTARRLQPVPGPAPGPSAVPADGQPTTPTSDGSGSPDGGGTVG